MDTRPPQTQMPYQDSPVQFAPPPPMAAQIPQQQTRQVAPPQKPHKARLGCFSVLLLSLTSIIFGSLGGMFLAYIFLVRPAWSTPLTDQISFLAPTPSPTVVTEATPVETTSDSQDVVSAVEKSSPAVVSIVAKTTKTDILGDQISQGIGTGFIVNADGLILTNKHVVESSSGATFVVITADGKEYEVKPENIAVDSLYDLAIIKIDAQNLPIATLGNSSTLKVGQQVIAIGLALGEFQNTVTVGVISGIGRSLQVSTNNTLGSVEYLDEIIQTDASINSGNSGGPLLNSSGQVIGINTAKVNNGENLGFAIPINSAKSVLENYQKNAGKIVRPKLGVSAVELTKALSLRNNLPLIDGAYLVEVQEGSAAQKAGLLKGDIIMQIDDTKITVKNSLRKQIQKKDIGTKATLLVRRGTEDKTIEVTLE